MIEKSWRIAGETDTGEPRDILILKIQYGGTRLYFT